MSEADKQREGETLEKYLSRLLRNERQQKRRAAEHPDTVAERNARTAQSRKTDEYRAKARKLKRVWTKKNRDRINLERRKKREANPEPIRAQRRANYAKNPGRIKAHKRKKRLENPALFLFESVRHRARRDGVPFTLPGPLPIPPDCESCGRYFVSGLDGGGRGNGHGPSYDRVIPSLSYIPGNVRVICAHCNTVKSNGDAALHRKIADYIDRHTKPKKRRKRGSKLDLT